MVAGKLQPAPGLPVTPGAATPGQPAPGPGTPKIPGAVKPGAIIGTLASNGPGIIHCKCILAFFCTFSLQS